mmetsp:Transcript_14942/g.34212  ORF Transcript_14942/g.34212 Transcript_14942/m.34212 type:complete len:299 (+) Transcript_14942:379-1275(+)
MLSFRASVPKHFCNRQAVASASSRATTNVSKSPTEEKCKRTHRRCIRGLRPSATRQPRRRSSRLWEQRETRLPLRRRQWKTFTSRSTLQPAPRWRIRSAPQLPAVLPVRTNSLCFISASSSCPTTPRTSRISPSPVRWIVRVPETSKSGPTPTFIRHQTTTTTTTTTTTSTASTPVAKTTSKPKIVSSVKSILRLSHQTAAAATTTTTISGVATGTTVTQTTMHNPTMRPCRRSTTATATATTALSPRTHIEVLISRSFRLMKDNRLLTTMQVPARFTKTLETTPTSESNRIESNRIE